MKIRIIRELSDKDHLILLGKKGSDFSPYLRNQDEKNYVLSKIKDDKQIIVLNQFNRFIFIHIIEENPDQKKYELLESLRKSAHSLFSLINDEGIHTVAITVNGTFKEELLAFTESLALSAYQFLKYLKDKKEKTYSLENIHVKNDQITEDEVFELSNLIEAVYHTRDLVNEPLSFLTANQLALQFEEMGKEAGFDVEVLNKKKIESLKMGGLLAVNKGSIDPPSFSIMEYKPENAVNKKPYVLVGKGIVYDTGGLSLKPTSNSMDYMKSDMAGAASVAGAIYAVAKSRMPVHIVGLVPATDNRPDGNAYVPGDVIRMYDGTTVEVLNTDAEGRLILADALAWAKQYKPELVIDLATLTGAALVAVGNQAMVGMSNASKVHFENLVESGYTVYERIAKFPFWPDYKEMLKSDIADLKNLGGKYAGAITAGKFLEHFTDYPYIHLDIAGPAFNKKKDSYRGNGGSGVGVRLLFNFFKKITRS